jgi:FSR family fosmidomycin resistance protein-like MFS transporter
MASGGRHGLAQSLFQVGGNTGASLGPLLAAWIIVPHGRGSVAWFSLAALLAIVVLLQVSRWYRHQHVKQQGRRVPVVVHALPVSKVVLAMSILGLLIFSKYFYLASLSSYYTFYLIHKFGASVQSAQVHLFVFLFAVAAGSLIRRSDRRSHRTQVGDLGLDPRRRTVHLLLPHVDLFWTGVLTVIIGLILSSAFSAILVYAQELIPGRVGMVSGLFFGFAFGMGGIGAAVLGHVADSHGIEYVYRICAYLPLMGLITVFLPNLERSRHGKLSAA